MGVLYLVLHEYNCLFQTVTFGDLTDDGFAPHRWQAIIWINDLVCDAYMRHSAPEK